MICMRTTIYIEEELYKKLIRESIQRFGSTKKLSVVINMFLKEFLKSKKQEKRTNFFGMLGKRDFELDDLRDEHDRSV